jgi:sugar lactone lactonase YvrE
MDAAVIGDTRDGTGESPFWDPARGRLTWSDNRSNLIQELTPDGASGWRAGQVRRPERRVGSAIPRRAGGFAVVGGVGLWFLGEDGSETSFVDLDLDPTQLHLNDSKCDAKGRVWTGSLTTDFLTPRGALYRIDPDGAVSEQADGLIVSNGLGWSPDDAVFYSVDSGFGTVTAFDFDLADGVISNPRILISFPKGLGVPDGMCVDADGCLWVAVYGTGEIRRFSPDGVLLDAVKVPALSVTSCAFGGQANDTLFITTGRLPIPEAAGGITGFDREKAESLVASPLAGGLFACRVGATGLPSHPFGG